MIWRKKNDDEKLVDFHDFSQLMQHSDFEGLPGSPNRAQGAPMDKNVNLANISTKLESFSSIADTSIFAF